MPSEAINPSSIIYKILEMFYTTEWHAVNPIFHRPPVKTCSPAPRCLLRYSAV
jgi:hypothetical protein